VSARDVLGICAQAFTPDDVAAAVSALLSDPEWDRRALYRAVLDALRALEGRLPGTARRIEHVQTEVSRDEAFLSVTEDDVERAIADLAGASQGALILRSGTLVLNTSFDELEVRAGGLLGTPGEPRRASTFRESS